MNGARLSFVSGLILLLLALAGFCWWRAQPVEYRASTVVVIETHSCFAWTKWPQEPLASGKIRDSRLQDEFFEELSALFSPEVLDPVIEKLALGDVWRLPDIPTARAALAERIVIKGETGTDLIYVTVRADEPGRAVALANAVTKSWRQLVISVDEANLSREREAAFKRRKEMEHKVSMARSEMIELLQPFQNFDHSVSREFPSFVIPEEQKQAYETMRQDFEKAKDELETFIEELERMRIVGVLRRPPINIFEEANLSQVVIWPDARLWKNTLIATSSLALLLLGLAIFQANASTIKKDPC